MFQVCEKGCRFVTEIVPLAQVKGLDMHRQFVTEPMHTIDGGVLKDFVLNRLCKPGGKTPDEPDEDEPEEWDETNVTGVTTGPTKAKNKGVRGRLMSTDVYTRVCKLVDCEYIVVEKLFRIYAVVLGFFLISC